MAPAAGGTGLRPAGRFQPSGPGLRIPGFRWRVRREMVLGAGLAAVGSLTFGAVAGARGRRFACGLRGNLACWCHGSVFGQLVLLGIVAGDGEVVTAYLKAARYACHAALVPRRAPSFPASRARPSPPPVRPPWPGRPAGTLPVVLGVAFSDPGDVPQQGHRAAEHLFVQLVNRVIGRRPG